MALEPGTRFGAYEVVEPLGSGGMGEVYRATDTTLGRAVAIKVLPESFAADADRVARFEQEAKTLAALNHANIAQIHGLERADGTTALVMELVEGPTLADRIAEGPLPPDEALNIAYQVADALEAAHERQIVHRDLKPANIKLRPDGMVKVLDFGIAKVLETQMGISGTPAPSLTTPAMTQAGVLLGTAAYMAPEQARGKPVDRRADIWAFGCLLYEMLTGQPAFGGEDVALTLARVLAQGTDMNSLPRIVSPAVRHTIALCLEKDPKKRIADIADVRLALKGGFETPLPSGAPSAVARPAWRRVLPVASAAAAAALVVALAAAWVVTPAREVRRSIYMIPEDQVLNAPVGAPLLGVSPDGTQIVYAAGGALYLRHLSELEGRPLAGTDGENPVVPVFSPDGEWILYLSSTGQLERVPVNGGTPLLVVAESPGLGWRWDEDGMVRYSTDCQIKQVPATGGTPQPVFNETGIGCVEPTLLPGTDYLLYERRLPGAQPDIVVRSLATGETTMLFPGKQPLYMEPGYLVYFDSVVGGLMARAFDPDTFEYGNAVALVDNILAAGQIVHYRVSASGTLIYLRGESATSQGFQLGIADEAGNLERLDVELGAFSVPSVSPDGTQVAMQMGGGDSAQIYVYDLSGEREMRQLTFDGGQQPAWSPDGQWIAYASGLDGRSRIYRRRADGRGLAEALTDPAEGKTHGYPAWAPDGERLAFSENGEEGSDIWIVAVPDGAPELLVGGSGNQDGVAFAPNGEALTYTSNTAGTYEIHAEPFPRDGSRIRISEDGVLSVWPVWSRDSSRLTYQVASGAILAVDLDTRDFAIRNRRTLPFITSSTERNLDTMPGSDRLLIAMPPFQSSTGLGARELVIVENWIEEVKQRVPSL